jgi:hypothetical protein
MSEPLRQTTQLGERNNQINTELAILRLPQTLVPIGQADKPARLDTVFLLRDTDNFFLWRPENFPV